MYGAYFKIHWYLLANCDKCPMLIYNANNRENTCRLYNKCVQSLQPFCKCKIILE
jgi:hypothetical protein